MSSRWLTINGDWVNLDKAYTFDVRKRSYIDQFGGRHITGYDVNMAFLGGRYVTIQTVTSNEAAQEFIRGFVDHYYGGYQAYDCDYPLGVWHDQYEEGV